MGCVVGSVLRAVVLCVSVEWVVSWVWFCVLLCCVSMLVGCPHTRLLACCWRANFSALVELGLLCHIGGSASSAVAVCVMHGYGVWSVVYLLGLV